MATPHLGEIRMAGFNFAPLGWAFCDGRLLRINDNDALFSLLGTTYGGDGQTTFALPDLRGRAPIHQGRVNAGPTHTLGEAGGTETVILLASHLPEHGYRGEDSEPDTTHPEGAALARGGAYAPGPANSGMVGSGLPHENRPPYLAVNYIIATEGIYPMSS